MLAKYLEEEKKKKKEKSPKIVTKEPLKAAAGLVA